MFFKQLYLGCLAQASYLIGSEGEAAVVDPRRDEAGATRQHEVGDPVDRYLPFQVTDRGDGEIGITLGSMGLKLLRR